MEKIQNKKICKSSSKEDNSGKSSSKEDNSGKSSSKEEIKDTPTIDVEVNSTNPELDAALNENKFLKQMNIELLAKIDDLTTRLHKYTNGQNHKRYYEKNKDKIKQSGATYLQKLKAENPEKIKEYSKRAYANKKKKLLDSSNNSILQPIVDEAVEL
jgi:hypothetical protein